MSIALHAELKRLRNVVEALENRVLLLEMQKRPVEAVGVPFEHTTITRKTLQLPTRGKAA